jgi:hypothetical protein
VGQEYGAAQPIVDVFKKGYEKVENLLGDPTKPTKTPADPMKSVPDSNANKQAWQKATEFHGPPAKVAPQKATRKPARKR